jgi:PAS domain S-box-containing protein
MKDQDKPKDQLIEELEESRRQLSELQDVLTETLEYDLSVDEPDSSEIAPSEEPQTIDLTGPLNADVTSWGSFDIGKDIWDTTFGKVLQALPAPVLLVDGSHDIILANQACGKIDAQYEQILGAPFARLFSNPVSREKVQSLIEDVFLTREPRTFSAMLTIGKGSVWGRTTLRSIKIMQQRYVLGIIEDLTSEKKQILADRKHQKSLQRAYDELEDRNRLLRKEVSDRKRVEEKLRWNETLLSQMATSSPLGYLVVDNRTDDILYFNQRFCGIWGIEHLADRMRNGQLNNNDLMHHCIPLICDAEAFAKSYKPLQDAGSRSVAEDTMDLRDGRTISRFSTQIQDEAGRYLGRFYIFEDITAKRRSEKELRESEQRLDLALKGADVGLWDYNLRTGEAFISERRAEMLGYSVDELEPYISTWATMVHPDDRKRVLDAFSAHWKGETPVYECEHRLRCKSGEYIWVLARGTVMERDAEGNPVRITGTSLDVTDRHRASDLITASRASFSSIVEATSDGVVVLDSGKRVLYANSAAISMFQRSKENIGEIWFDHPVVLEETTEMDIVRPDGSTGVAEMRVESTEWEGQPAHLAMLRDVTAQRKAQKVQRRLATAIAQSAETVIITDSEGIIKYVNPAFESRSGYTEAEVIGKRTRFWHKDEHDEEFYRQLRDTVQRGEIWKGRFASKRKDGTLYYEDATISPVRDAAGEIVNVVTVKRDVTQQLELEQQLRHSQKMEAVGTLAGGIAHDFNNLLQVVVGYGELLSTQLDKTAPYYNDLEIILKAGHRGADLVKRILTFSRQAEADFRPVNLNHEVKQAHTLLLRTIPKMIGIETSLADNLKTVRADPTQIEQILLNLAVNSRDAMPDGGRLIIETENLILDEDYARRHVEVKPGHYVRLTVSDTGCGMYRETGERVFDPFFTTKETGQGTGLGLSTVYGIVKNHGGHVTCYSEPSVGTTFKIDFPVLETEIETDVIESAEMPAFGTETILVVDDEEHIRELARRNLNKAGYTVLMAANGIEALAVYRKNQSDISLVILDLIMPEMGGMECLEELVKVNPNVKVLIASGFSPAGPPRESIKVGVHGFVDKPFRVKEMLTTIRRVLDEG